MRAPSALLFPFVLAARKSALYFWMRFVHSGAEEEFEEESVANNSSLEA